MNTETRIAELERIAIANINRILMLEARIEDLEQEMKDLESD